MPLAVLLEDPEPTNSELIRFYRSEWDSVLDARSRRFLALCSWRHEQKIKGDSLFHVHFASQVPGYEAYLKGDVWNIIRKRVLALFGNKCAGCRRKATEVHHRDYRPRVLRGEDDTPLVALCRSCHLFVHDKGKDRSWQYCERTLATIVAAEDARLRIGDNVLHDALCRHGTPCP